MPRADLGAPLLGAVVEQVAVLGHRQDGDADAEFVHLLERHLWATTADWPVLTGRQEMMVHVDGAAANVQLDHALLAEQAGRRSQRRRAGGGDGLQECPSAGHDTPYCRADCGHTVPWCGAGTRPMPLKTNFCRRLPSQVSVV